MKIIILDTETTGVLDEDRIIQLSYLVVNMEGEIEEVHDDFCSAPLDIKFDAMAVHHIVPEQLEGKPACVDTKAFARLNELNTSENLMVIQNAEFDLAMLLKEGFTSQMQLLDTFRILRAKYTLDGGQGLQYKRYQWGLYKKEQAIIDSLGIEVRAHDALGDVIVLKNLLDYLCNENDMQEMIDMCANPILVEIMPFGKHKGKNMSELALTERNALDWMLKNFDLDTDMKHTLTHFLAEGKKNAIISLGFGKYKGQTPEQIGEKDMGYLKWLYEKAENISEELREAINLAYEKSTASAH